MTDLSGNTFGLFRTDRGYFTMGATPLVFPIQDGAGLSFPPKFLDAPGAANNVYDVSYYNGVYYPTARVPADILSTWFTAANLNSWFVTRDPTRGEAGYDDLAKIAGDCVLSDGHRAINILNAKGAAFSMSSRQNDIVRASMVFMGASKTEGSWTSVAAPTAARSSFADVVFISGVTGVVDFTLSIDNRCGPSPIIGAGTGSSVIEINAGKPRIMLMLLVDAAGTFPTMGTPIVFTVNAPGAAHPVQFTIANPRIDQPDNISRSGDRASQAFQITCQSTDGVTFPLAIATGT